MKILLFNKSEKKICVFFDFLKKWNLFKSFLLVCIGWFDRLFWESKIKKKKKDLTAENDLVWFDRRIKQFFFWFLNISNPLRSDHILHLWSSCENDDKLITSTNGSSLQVNLIFFFFFFCLSKSGFGALVKDIFFKNSSKWKKIKLCILLNAKFLQYRMIVLFSPFQTKNWAFQFLPSFGFCRSIRKKNLSNPNRFWKTYQKVSIFLLSICDGQSKNREILFASWFWLSRRNFHPSIFWKWKEGLIY